MCSSVGTPARFSAIYMKALFSALELGVFNALEEQPATAEELGQRLGLAPRPSRLLLLALLGEGIVDFPAVFRLLNERGFQGPFTMELEGIGGENLSEEQQQQRVAASVGYLRGHGLVP